MSTPETSAGSRIESIQAIDRIAFRHRPKTKGLEHREFLGDSPHVYLHQGRFIYGTTPAEIYQQYDPESEHIPSLIELMRIRALAFDILNEEVPSLAAGINELIEQGEYTDDIYDILKQTRKKIDADPETFGVWQVRLTTSSHMVRAKDEQGEDAIFFYHKNPFVTEQELADAMRGNLSDGGICYTPEAIRRIITETKPESRLPYSQYLSAKGGNFNGMDFLHHPVFSTACGDRILMERYVYSLQMLSLLNYYHTAKHSGWRLGEMKKEFGRPMSLGAVGEAFYPPNNDTIDHAVLALEK